MRAFVLSSHDLLTALVSRLGALHAGYTGVLSFINWISGASPRIH